MKIRALGADNRSIFMLAVAFFIANQMLEIFFMSVFDADYSKLCHFDCGWYSGMVSNGYHSEPFAHPKMDAANWAFFPLFPMLAKAFYYITGVSDSVALIITSKITFLLSIFAFMKMVKAYAPDIKCMISGSVVAFSPYAVYGNVGYTESLFLLLSCWFFFYLKKERFLAAALVGSMLTSVRLAGVFAVVSYALEGIRSIRNKSLDIYIYVLGVLLIPLGLAAFMFYLYGISGDALAFSHIQRAWGRDPGNPFMIIYNGFMGGLLYKYFALLSVFALLASVYLAYKKMYGFAIFAILCTLVPLSTGLWAMPRYIFWQAPILFFMAYLISKNKFLYLLFPIFIFVQGFIYRSWFLWEAWTI